MPKKYYAYEIYEKRDGSKKIRNISNKKDTDFMNAIYSKKTPKERKLMEEAYNMGVAGIGEKTGADEYAQTVEWGQMGGRPRKWENHAEKIQAYRLRKKLKQGGSLNNKQVEWLKTRGINVANNQKLNK